jgi:signal transduction histidine kinase
MELAKAEKEAALAEITRQINHDIKNGFIPIRRVMQHWMEVAENESEKLIQVFNERKMTVLESLDYLENLVRSYSRLRPNVVLSAVKVNQVVLDLLRNYQDPPHRRIQFQTQLDPSEPCVQADTLQLRRAFENILCNAIEAINDDGTIFVSTKVKDNLVLITWNDTGAGIPENIRQQLFYEQVTTKSDGSGLGLINAKRIIEDFGGTIAIESEVGRGAPKYG